MAEPCAADNGTVTQSLQSTRCGISSQCSSSCSNSDRVLYAGSIQLMYTQPLSNIQVYLGLHTGHSLVPIKLPKFSRLLELCLQTQQHYRCKHKYVISDQHTYHKYDSFCSRANTGMRLRTEGTFPPLQGLFSNSAGKHIPGSQEKSTPTPTVLLDCAECLGSQVQEHTVLSRLLAAVSLGSQRYISTITSAGLQTFVCHCLQMPLLTPNNTTDARFINKAKIAVNAGSYL